MRTDPVRPRPRWWRDLPIRVHLALFAAGILVPLLAIVTVMLINTARLWRDDSIHDARLIAQHLNATIEVELEKTIAVAQTLATGLVVFGHDLGTALVLFAILLGMLWVVGAPARFFALSFLVVSVFAGLLATTDPERLTRITTFTDPMRDYSSAGWQPAHGLFATRR